MSNRRFGVGRTGKTKAEVDTGSSVKAIIGVFLLLAFSYLIFLSINYRESKFGEVGISSITKGPDNNVNISNLNDCNVRIFISKEKSDRGLEVKDLVKGLGFSNVSMSFIVSSSGQKDKIYFIPTSSLSVNKLDEWAAAISKEAGLPEPVRLDAQFIVGQDMANLYEKAIGNNLYDLSGLNIEVLNGSGIGGAASQVADILRNKGANILDVRNADSFDYKKTFLKTGLGQKSRVMPIVGLFGLGDGRIDDSLDQIIVVLCE
jgi:hypothetical protein